MPRLITHCLNCKIEYSYSTNTKRGKFCSNACQWEYDFLIRYKNWFLGTYQPIGPRATKKLIEKRDGYKCSECGINEWNGKFLVLELEHKDGNHKNNKSENVCLICPNCHNYTPTYKGRNPKGKGRDYFRRRYHESKSQKPPD